MGVDYVEPVVCDRGDGGVAFREGVSVEEALEDFALEGFY